MIFDTVTNKLFKNLLDGTVAAGNAKKLNGLTDTDFQKTVSKVVDSTVTLAELEDMLPTDGKGRFVYRSGAPSDFPTALHTPTTSGLLSVEVNKVGGVAYYNINAVQVNGIPVKITGYYNGTFYWEKDNDGGNADTVNGYHASDFAKSDQFISGSNGWAAIQANKADGAIYRVQLNTAGNLSLYKSIDKGVTWEQLTTWDKNYLPLTGGTLTGDLYIKKANYPTQTRIINYDGNTFLRDYVDDNNYQDLVIRSNGGLKYLKRENGKGTETTILHTGNSNAVIFTPDSTTAPSDANALWAHLD